MDSANELLEFLKATARLDLKAVALTNVLSLTGTQDGLETLTAVPDLLLSLIQLLCDESDVISKDAALSLINISGFEKGAGALLNLSLEASDTVVSTTLKFILDRDSHISDPCCMILSNISRNSAYINTVVNMIEKSQVTFDVLINAFTKNNYNSKDANLHYLGPLLSNLSQSSRVRRYILDKEKCVIQRLVPFTEYKESNVRRGGIVGTLRNCCFETESHGWLLSEDVDILPCLLLPLAGSIEYEEEDNDKLPLELQYLPDDKEREEDPDIRCMLLECLMQLCILRENREYVRSKNTYIILRELHKWETNRKVLLVCENLINILIRTEDEIGHDNLKEVDVPEHLHETFKEMDANFLSDTS